MPELDMTAVTLRFAGGDGDPDYTGEQFDAHLLSSGMHEGITDYGRALAIRIISGRHKGEIAAIASRTDRTLESQMKSKFVSTILLVPEKQVSDAAELWHKGILMPVGMIAAEVMR